MLVPAKGRIRVGTSGWSYPDWRDKFYLSTLPKAQWFRHYSTVFDTVELNSTYYGTPKSAVFQAWACAAPDQFVYALKADRDLTHRVGKNRNLVLKALCDGARILGVHKGPILYQFPPWLGA